MYTFLKSATFFSLGNMALIGGLLAGALTSQTLSAQSDEDITAEQSLDQKRTQLVFLDFEAGGLPTFDYIGGDGEIITLPDHIYTTEERDEILREVQKRFFGFNVIFTQEKPPFGEFSTVLLGLNDDRLNRSFSFSGIAESIDFRNLNRSDQVIVDPSGIIISADQTSIAGLGFFKFATGIPVVTTLEDAVSTAVVRLSIQVTSHEVGHILGLRHHDAFGPIGSGIPDETQFGNLITRNAYKPPYEGPNQADEFNSHLMLSGSSTREDIPFERFFSERSAIKLTINKSLAPISEENIANELSIQEVSLEELEVPNTLLEGVNANKELNVSATVIEGTLASPDDLDFYIFSGEEGDVVTIEGISTILDRLVTTQDQVITRLVLSGLSDDGIVDVAFNFQDSETFDPQILDATLPFTGEYVILVESSNEAFFNGDRFSPGQDLGFLDERDGDFLRDGKYELLIYKWQEPTEFSQAP